MKQAIHFKSITFLVIMLVYLTSWKAKAQTIDEISITGNFFNVRLSSFFNTIEKDFDIKIYYKNEWIESYKINTSFNNTSLDRALTSIFNNRDLTYEIYQDNAIIVFPRKLDTRVSMEDSTIGMVIGNPINNGKFKTATLTGKVNDGKNGTPLPGAVIYNTKLNKGVNTDINGNFTMQLPTGENILKVSFMGFEDIERKVILIESGEVEFDLFDETHNLGEVSVIADGLSTSRTQMSMVQMSSKEMKALPLLMGERDIVKSIVMLPGIQSVGELSSGFNVRGGNSDQNLILFDGAPVFNISHLYGFLSAINPDVVKDMTVFKGGLPVRYGERVSSVMEIEMKEGNEEHIKLTGGLGTINSRLAIDGPLTKNKKLTFFAAGRMSYADWILKQVQDPVISKSVTKFYDATGKISYRFDNSNWLNVTSYSSNDKFSTSAQSVNEYGNLLFDLLSHNKYGEKLNGEISFTFSKYNFRLTEFPDGKNFEAYYLNNSIKYNSLKYHFIWHPYPLHTISTGFSAIRYINDPGKVTPVYDNSIINVEKLDEENAFEGALYLGDEFDLFTDLTVNFGLRYSYYALFGAKTVFLYDNELPKSASTVVDSVVFNKGDVVKSYGGLEPRISFNWKTNENYSIKLSYQRTRQFIYQISNNAVISPAETWKTSDYYLEPLISDQIALGIQKNSFLNKYSLLMEMYYKQLQNIIEYKNGAQIVMNKHLETDLIPSNGYSYGFELSLKKPDGRLTGWLNYTYSRTMRKTSGNFDEEQINSGKFYPSIYDKPHDLSVIATYNISRRWRVSGNFVLISGRPVTLPEMKYQYAGETMVYFSDRNKYRMPSYHRFDLSITIDENLKKRRMWKGSWTLSVYNLYGRNNPYSVYYRKVIDGAGSSGINYSLFKLSVIGVPVPSLTYNFTF